MIAVACVDLQFGSTGKGLMAAYLGERGYFNNRPHHEASRIEFTAVATNWGPNAGHTSVYPDGHKCVRTMLSNAVHRGTPRRQYIGPGSAINFDAIAKELCDTMEHGNPDLQIFIHENTAVVRPEHAELEKRHNRIGSTQKGTAEAWVAKMNRDPDDPCIARYYKGGLFEGGMGVINIVSHAEYLDRLYAEDAVLLEGCQGYSLGISSGFWPYVTARECTAMQLMADTLIPYDSLLAVVGCARTYPIRVANRYDLDGKLVGFSGPCYPDQIETSFADIGQPVELTTVTKLPRRIFTFSYQQIREAVAVNGCNEIFMNFMNYIPTADGHAYFVRSVNSYISPYGAIRYLGYGPSVNDVTQEF